MLKCRYNIPPIFDCVQWVGSNMDEIKQIFGGKVNTSPYSKDQITLKGGDSYVVVDLHDWILIDPEGNFHLVDKLTFDEYYELIEGL